MQGALEDAVEQRLLAEPIARQKNATGSQVGNGEREHAIEVLDAGIAEFFVGVDNRFGIGLRAELVAARNQRSPKIVMVVDLAVEGDPHLSVFVGHGLFAARPVDDGKASMAKCQPGRMKGTAAIWTAMAHRVRHPVDGLSNTGLKIPVQANDAADAAHSSCQSKAIAKAERESA